MMGGWLVANNVFLLLCTSMYLGTGWSLMLFSFPIEPQLRVDNYSLQFVPQVTAATRFFTVMTALMMGSSVVMLVGEPDASYRVLPIIVLVAVVAATALTMVFILPYNKRMEAGITDEAELHSVLRRWMARIRLRGALWTLQWAAMAVWFGAKVAHS